MHNFPQLNLPPIDCKVDLSDNGKCHIFCILRRRWVTLTPEEWVRQHFVSWLISKGYPQSLMANEVSITLNGMSRRCDTVVWDRTATRPLAIIEYKAPDVALTDGVIRQVTRYNLALCTRMLIVSNGIRHICMSTGQDGSMTFMTGLPTYDELI